MLGQSTDHSRVWENDYFLVLLIRFGGSIDLCEGGLAICISYTRQLLVSLVLNRLSVVSSFVKIAWNHELDSFKATPANPFE